MTQSDQQYPLFIHFRLFSLRTPHQQIRNFHSTKQIETEKWRLEWKEKRIWITGCQLPTTKQLKLNQFKLSELFKIRCVTVASANQSFIHNVWVVCQSKSRKDKKFWFNGGKLHVYLGIFRLRGLKFDVELRLRLQIFTYTTETKVELVGFWK